MSFSSLARTHLSVLILFRASRLCPHPASRVQEEGWSSANPRRSGSGGGRTGKRGSGAVDATSVAAAASVASRYVSALRPKGTATASRSPSAGTGPAPSGPGPAEDVSAGRTRTGLTCRGRDAADAAVSLESPEFASVLEAWESAKANEGTAAAKHGQAEANRATEGTGLSRGSGRSGPISSREGLAPEAPRDGVFEGGNGESDPSSEKQLDDEGGQLDDDDDQEEEEEEEEEEDRQGKTGMSASLVRAAEALRAFDEYADPQGALCLGEANAWVVKPAGLSCGRGVEVTSSLRGLVAACRRLEWKAVVQKYVERPLLVQVRHFHVSCLVFRTSRIAAGTNSCSAGVCWSYSTPPLSPPPVRVIQTTNLEFRGESARS